MQKLREAIRAVLDPRTQNRLRDARFRVQQLLLGCRRVLTAIRGRPRIAFWPDRPSTSTALDRAFRYLGFVITNNPQARTDIYVKWVKGTEWSDSPRFPTPSRVVNGDIVDIKKTRVVAAYESVFGVTFEVNPLTYEGKAVRKSNLNAAHDGEVVDCPLRPSEVVEGSVYQLFVDTTGADGLREELRAMTVAGQVVAVVVKKRKPENWFQIPNDAARLAMPGDVFSSEELERLGALCSAMCLDYGDLDVLRDVSSGKIFVIDVNPTPDGPPIELSAGEFGAVALLVGQRFSAAFGPPGMAPARLGLTRTQRNII